MAVPNDAYHSIPAGGSGFLLRQDSSGVSLSSGVQLTISTRSGDGTEVGLKTSLEPATDESFYRIFRDENNLAVIAYEHEVARTADGQNFRVTAKSASEALSQ
jgi:hypothetical protein